MLTKELKKFKDYSNMSFAMSVEAGRPWEYSGLKFWGLSLSGIRTSIAMPELSLAFDVAQGYPFTLSLKKFFLTHGHLDHAAGVPYIISQKAMLNQPPAHFYMPKSLVDPLHRIMRIWMEIEEHEYKYEFHGLEGGEKIELNAQAFVRPFRSVHRIDSCGYTLFQRKTKLKSEYQGFTQQQLAKLREQNKPLQDELEIPVVSFTGDTQIEFLDSADWIKKSKILFLEATYLDGKKTREHARTWGHTHLDEIIERLDEIESERIVLIHASSRYSSQEAVRILQDRIPAKHQERVLLFPGR